MSLWFFTVLIHVVAFTKINTEAKHRVTKNFSTGQVNLVTDENVNSKQKSYCLSRILYYYPTM